MKKNPWSISFFLVGGLVLGVVFTAVVIGGIGLAGGALLHSALTVPTPPAAGPGTSEGSLHQEIASLLSEAHISSSTTISKASLNRLISTALGDVEPSNAVLVHSLELDLEPSRLRLRSLATVRAPGTELPTSLRPQTIQVNALLSSQTAEAGLLLSLQSLSIGRLGIPRKLAQSILAAFARSDVGMPVEARTAGEVFVPYALFADVIPPAITIRALLFEKDALVARIELDEAVREQLVSEAAPLVREHSPALRRAVERVLGLDHPVGAAVNDLAATASLPPAPPVEPTALISYVENEVEATPPAGTSFVPTVGTDLSSGTFLRTGALSYVECELTDSSVLRIDEETEVLLEDVPLSSENPRGRFTLLAGRIRAKVADATGTDYSFKAANSVCGVRGTDLILELPRNRIVVLSVLEGSVVVTPPEGSQRAVSQNESARIDGEAVVSDISPEARTKFESEVAVRTVPSDAEEIRETAWLWSLMNSAKSVAVHVAALDRETQAHLSTEVRREIDAARLRPRLERILAQPEVRESLSAMGATNPLAWLNAPPSR